jgi:hypothetical protein
MTTLTCRNSSPAVAATRAPAARNGSLFSAERFRTTSGVLARTMLSAIG